MLRVNSTTRAKGCCRIPAMRVCAFPSQAVADRTDMKRNKGKRVPAYAENVRSERKKSTGQQLQDRGVRAHLTPSGYCPDKSRGAEPQNTRLHHGHPGSHVAWVQNSSSRERSQPKPWHRPFQPSKTSGTNTCLLLHHHKAPLLEQKNIQSSVSCCNIIYLLVQPWLFRALSLSTRGVTHLLYH